VDAVTDEIWDAVADYYDVQGLVAIILMIATTNLFTASTPPSGSLPARAGLSRRRSWLGTEVCLKEAPAPLPANSVVTAERARIALRPTAAQVLLQECP
jgi:hypothetical protein